MCVRDDDPAVTVERLGAGLHVLTNDRIGSPWFPKEGRARDLVPVAAVPAMNLDAVFAALHPVLVDHAIPPGIPAPPAGSLLPTLLAEQLQALCVHTPGYGTVSATMLAVGPAGVARYRFADGAPCRTPFVDHTALLAGAPAQRP